MKTWAREFRPGHTIVLPSIIADRATGEYKGVARFETKHSKLPFGIWDDAYGEKGTRVGAPFRRIVTDIAVGPDDYLMVGEDCFMVRSLENTDEDDIYQ